MKKIKRPLSILLSVLMVVSLFTVVPLTASANELSSASSQEVSASDNQMFVAGSEAEIFGTAWDATIEENLMTLNQDGTYTKTYTVEKAYKEVQLKAVLNSTVWFGNETGNNVTFNLTGEGTFTVTATPSGDGYAVSVSGDNVELITGLKYNTVYAVGNGEGNWLNGVGWNPSYFENEMTEVDPDVWEIEFTEVPEGFDRQIKFAIDGAWTYNFGGTFEDSGVTSAAVYDGGNITFDTDDDVTVKVQLDLSNFDFTTKEGATFTITITEAEEPTTEEPTTEVPTTEEPTTEEPTTEYPPTEAAPADDMIVAGSEPEIFGTAWDGANEANLMDANQDGTFTKTYTVTKAYEAVQLKAVLNGAFWYGDPTGNNVIFNLTGAGEFTVTATPVEGGYVVSVSGDNVGFITEFEYDTVYAAGNGEGNWLYGAAWDTSYVQNEMAKAADDVWEIEFTEVPEGFDRQIKFAIDGTWAHNFGGTFEESGAVTAAVYNGDNITFDTDDDVTVKVQLDLSNFDFTTKEGATFTITISYEGEEEPTTEEPTTEEPTTEEPTTEEPTTEAPDPSDLEAANVVISTINALPAVPSIANKNAFVVAKNAYETLTMAQRNLVPQELSQKLYAALDTIADLEAAAPVTEKINALPDVADVTVDDKTDVEAARAAYDALTDDQKDCVSAETLQKLVDVEERIADIEAANMIAALIEPLPTAENVTLDDARDIYEVVNAYEQLTQAQRNLVPPALVEKLYADNDKVGDLQAAASVTEKINALPAANEITLEDKTDVMSARADYESLTDAQKELIDAAVLAKLVAVEKSINDQEEAKAATDLINDLPAEITLEDEADVQAARLAYDALTDDQKALVTEATVNKLAAAERTLQYLEDIKAAEEVTNMINALPGVLGLRADDKDAVEAAQAAYDALTDQSKSFVSLADKLKLSAVVAALPAVIKAAEDQAAAADVTALIRALPSAVNVTVNDKEAIENAANAYDALTDDQKRLISLADRLKLTADKGALDAAEKIYEDETAAKAVEAMIEALPAAADVTLADEEAINSAKAAYDALTDDQKRVVTLVNRTKLELDVAVLAALEDEAAADPVEAMIEALPASADVTVDDADAINTAKAAYDALTDAQKRLVPLNLRTKLAADVAALTEAENDEAADAVEAMIDALPAASDVTLEDKEAIEAARAAYDALTPAQKRHVTLVNRTKLVLDEAAVAKIVNDNAAAAAVKEQIEALPNAEDLTYADRDAVLAARAAYNRLTDDQKALIDFATVSKLNEDENVLVGLTEVEIVKGLINALPAADQVTARDKDYIEFVRNAYNTLPEDLQKLVDEDTMAKLTDAEDAMAAIEADMAAAADVEAMIDALPNSLRVTLEDKEAIEAASEAFDALTDAQKAYVPARDRIKLEADKAVLAALEKAAEDSAAADAVEELIEALPAATAVTVDDKDAIAAADEAYNALTDDQKDYVSTANKIKLAAAKGALAAAEKAAADEAAADVVEDMIDALPAPGSVTINDKEDIAAAREAYDALTPDQKRLVTLVNRAKLVFDEAALAKIENDIAAADAVTEQINALPAAEDVTFDDNDAILAARDAYDKLTDDQKALVTDDTLKKLTDAEEALAKVTEVMAVKEAIDNLPAAEDVTLRDTTAIEAARAAYDALDDAQKAQIDDDTLKKLTDAEEALAKAQADKEAAEAVEALIEALPNPLSVTIDDKEAIEQAQAAYDALTPEQHDLVSLADRVKLAVDAAVLQKIEDDIAAAGAVTDMINALPAVEDLTYDDKADVEAAREAFDNLTFLQKVRVGADTYQKLAEAEDRMSKFALLGDANGDGKITVKDVTAIQRHIAEIDVLSGNALTSADVNQDGKITIDDATALQMYLAEMEVEYPIGEMV